MADSHKGVAKHHARPAVGHDPSNPMAHSGLVALYPAGVARPLMLVWASPGSFESVPDRLRAILAEPIPIAAPDMAMAMAVDTCHGHQGELVFSQFAFAKLVCACFDLHTRLF